MITRPRRRKHLHTPLSLLTHEARYKGVCDASSVLLFRTHLTTRHSSTLDFNPQDPPQLVIHLLFNSH